MNRIKRFDVKYTFVYGADLLLRMPAWYARLRGSRRCFATALLTNLGGVLDQILPVEQQQLVVGNLRLTSVAVAPTYRQRCSAAFALTEFLGNVNICLHYDPRALDRASAGNLLSNYLKQIRETAVADQ